MTTTTRVRFDIDTVRVGSGPVHVSIRVIEHGQPETQGGITRFNDRVTEVLEREYAANWTPVEAAADLLRIYRDTPYTALRGE